MVVGGGELLEISTENSKLVVDQLMDKYWWLCPLRELILNHESEFGDHRIHDDGSWKRKFKDPLIKSDIKSILALINHPQQNGKLELLFGE
jgi:putative transposase